MSRQRPKRETRTKRRGKHWRNNPLPPAVRVVRRTTDAAGRMHRPSGKLDIPNMNDQWALVELHRWQYGGLPQPDDVRRVAFKPALEAMGSALWNTEPTHEGAPRPETPAPFNVASVFKFCQRFLAGRIAPEDVSGVVTGWMAEQADDAHMQAMSNARLTWPETLAAAIVMIHKQELGPPSARYILDALADALEAADPHQ